MKEILFYTLKKLPDLRIQKYLSVYGSWSKARSEVFERQRTFLAFLHDLGEKITVSLRYDYDPARDGLKEPKLKIFLIVRNQSDIENRKLDGFIREGFLKDFYIFEPSDKSVDFSSYSWISSISSIIKAEEKIFPLTKSSTVPYYYLVFPFEPNPENDFIFLDRLLETIDKKILVDITLTPYRISLKEYEAIKNMITKLEEAERGTITDAYKKKDATSEIALRLFEDYYNSFLTEKTFKYSIRIGAEDIYYGELIARSIALASTTNDKYRIISISKDKDPEDFEKEFSFLKSVSSDTIVEYKDFWSQVTSNQPTILAMRSLPHIATLNELSGFFRIIVPGFEVLKTVHIETDPELKFSPEEKEIEIGVDANKEKVKIKIALDQLKKHMFVSGVTGSGKTTSIFNILIQLWGKYNIPFLVIEPSKTEYRILKTLKYSEDPIARKVGEDLRIYTLGEERISPFRFNPFEFQKYTSINEHLGTLDTCFKGALPLWNPLPAIIGEAMEEMYARFGWTVRDTGEEVESTENLKVFPIMKEFYDIALKVAQRKEYSSTVSKDITTAIEVRLGTLLRRSVGPMINSPYSLPSIEELMKYPTILEMDYLNEEQSNLMTMFILAKILDYVRTTRKAGSELKHVIVLEEAHNIVGIVSELPYTGEFADPKGEATKYITKMLSEIRTYGEGIIIADQIPSRMAPDVIKNTNIKLIHRIVAGDDREIIGQTMLMNPGQAEEIARFNPGEAFFYIEGIYFPLKVICTNPFEKFKFPVTHPPFGLELLNYIKDEKWYIGHQKLREEAFKIESILWTIENTAKKLERNYENLKIRIERVLRSGRPSKDEIRNVEEEINERLRFLSTFLKNKYESEIIPSLEKIKEANSRIWIILFKRVKMRLEWKARPAYQELYNKYLNLTKILKENKKVK